MCGYLSGANAPVYKDVAPIGAKNTRNFCLNCIVFVSVKTGSQLCISENGVLLFNKFVKQVEKIFKKIPKRLEWQSFYTHDMSLILEICDDIRHISLKNQLNKSQIQSLSDVKRVLLIFIKILLIQKIQKIFKKMMHHHASQNWEELSLSRK